MLKQLVTLLFIINSTSVFSQKKETIQKEISGIVTNKPIKDDTIYFDSAHIAGKYFEKTILSSKLTDNKFVLVNKVSYPQMYRVHFATDKGKIIYRKRYYFIGPTTTAIKTNYPSDDCSEINGVTDNEYQTKFIPFITKGTGYNCNLNNISGLFYDQDKQVDSLLFSYTVQNPNSYVALWMLIERYSLWGHNNIRQKTLAVFSGKIKSEKLWDILNDDFKHAKIKINEKFPDISLKTLDLNAAKLILPKAKYTLIDYWFSRCRPCLDTIPVLKKLYFQYKDKGFDIVSISVDQTANVPIWQKRVKEHGLVWAQYLDENNFQDNKLGIKFFPTFILLDRTGKIIWRDFDLNDLDKFLSNKL